MKRQFCESIGFKITAFAHSQKIASKEQIAAQFPHLDCSTLGKILVRLGQEGKMILGFGGYRNTDAQTRAVIDELRRASRELQAPSEIVPSRTVKPFAPMSAKHRVSSLGVREGSNDARAWRSKFDV
jgi:hypothetical protein